MNKHLLEMKHTKTDRSDNLLARYQETEEAPLLDDSVQINISHLGDGDSRLDFEEFKKEVDRNFEEKKIQLKQMYTFTKTINENKIKENFENRFKLMLNEEHERLEENIKKKQDEYLIKKTLKIEQAKSTLIDEFKKKIIEKIKNKENQIKLNIKKLEDEISDSKSKINNSKPNVFKIEDEIKKIEDIYSDKLKTLHKNLEIKLLENKSKIKSFYLNKKEEFQELARNKIKEVNEKSQDFTQELYFQETKNALLKSHESKIKSYQESLELEYKDTLEREKQNEMITFKSIVKSLKINYESTSECYNEHKLCFDIELNVMNIFSILSKLENISENKNIVIQNFIEQNYFITNKKVRECEKIKELEHISNKDKLLSKISEIFNLIFLEHLYEYLITDVKNVEEFKNTYLEEITKKFEKILSNLNFDKKLHINMLLSNLNLNN
jgi:hypothetical protein